MLNEDISDICAMILKRAKVNYILLVALASGELQMYRDLSMIYSFKLENKPILALCFGTYGREESSLIIVHGQNGALTIKMWKRTTEIESLTVPSGPPPEQGVLSVYSVVLFVMLTCKDQTELLNGTFCTLYVFVCC